MIGRGIERNFRASDIIPRMPRVSAGILVYRKRGDALEFLLVHPGGPFWAKRDENAWSIPKGETEEEEDLLSAAKREFEEEVGQPAPAGDFYTWVRRREGMGS